MRSLMTVAIAAALLTPVLVYADGTASAEAPPNTWIECPDGRTSSGQLTIAVADPQGRLNISGHVEPCSTPQRTDVFTVAAYYPDTAAAATVIHATYSWYAPYSLDSLDESSTFVDRIRVRRDVQAVCLVTGAQDRVQCYEVSTGAASTDIPTVGAAIPTTDPRVQHPVPCPLPAPGDRTTPPSCASCW